MKLLNVLWVCWSFVGSLGYSDCPDGKVYTSCGSYCPLTCDSYQDPPACVQQCVEGCFCPEGQVEHNGTCLAPEDCTTVANEGCPDGKVYTSCGSYCPLTCDSYQDPPACVQQCVEGCFCSKGQVEHNGTCLAPEDCTTSLELPEATAPGIAATSPPPSCLHATCNSVSYVPCGPDSQLQCDSEFTHCLQHNVTRASSCVSSCLAHNGGCKEEVCVTVIEAAGHPHVQCLALDELPQDCPAGQVMRECGTGHQRTCQEHLFPTEEGEGKEACGPPSCVCPEGLVLFRDRCVNPQLCYILLTYPPAIKPLPLVKADQFLYSLNCPDSSLSKFEWEEFLGSMRDVLTGSGYPQVQVTLHGVYQDRDLQVVVQVSGDGMSRDSSHLVASLLTEQSHQLHTKVNRVSIMDVRRVAGSEEEWEEEEPVSLSTVVVYVALLLLMAGMGVLGCACCTLSSPDFRRARRRARREQLKWQVELLALDDDLQSEAAVKPAFTHSS